MIIEEVLDLVTGLHCH